MPDPVMALPAPSTPHLAPSWERPVVPPAPGEARLLPLESSLQHPLPGERPALPVAPREPRCHGHLSSPGHGDGRLSVTLAALKTLGEGWGEEALPACSGMAAQHHPRGSLGASVLLGLTLLAGLGLHAVHHRVAGSCSLSELPQGFPHPLTKKGEGLRVPEAAIRSSHRQCFVGWMVLGSARCGAGGQGRRSFCYCELLTALEELFKCSSLCAETAKASPACVFFPFCPGRITQPDRRPLPLPPTLPSCPASLPPRADAGRNCACWLFLGWATSVRRSQRGCY